MQLRNRAGEGCVAGSDISVNDSPEEGDWVDPDKDAVDDGGFELESVVADSGVETDSGAPD